MTASAPDVNAIRPASAPTSAPVLGFDRVTKLYRGLAAVDQVSFTLHGGRTLGLVGESGSGKSTCVRLALGLERPSSGQLTFAGQPYPRSRRRLRPLRRRVGFVLQDSYDSLDPRLRLRDIVAEPLRVHRIRAGGAGQRVADLLVSVGLPDASLDSYPSRYSGGGRQRIAIARALITDPELLICDEPTSSLDVSVQAQIVNLLLDAKRSRDLSVLFVSHDLDLIGRVADSLVVMYRGRVVESGPAELVRSRPRHHYTKALHEAVPADHPARRQRWSQGPPLPADPRSSMAAEQAAPSAGSVAGACCVFADRCPAVQARCRSERPPVATGEDGRSYACFFPLEV
jgi:peptide/nickel transport system ATP-binding protein